MVARPLWERKAAGSNPVTPTVAQKALNCEDEGFMAFLLARIAMRMPWALTTRGSHHDYQHDHYRADVGRLVDAHADHLQPWCVDGDGHPGAAFVDDQWCHGRERRVPLSLEAPACSTTGHESPST